MRVPLAVVATTLVLSGCSSPSLEELEAAVADKPGVVSVEANEEDGDDGIPWDNRVIGNVRVQMSADATAEQVSAVFEEYDDDKDDRTVIVVEVVLGGKKKATLTTGEGVHADEAMVAGLVEAQGDPTITGYRRDATPALPGVEMTLEATSFSDVLSAADRHPDIDLVQVRGGGFLLIRDRVNARPAITSGREEFVTGVLRHHELTGAVVSGRGSLDLFASPADLKQVQAYVDSHRTPSLKRVVVRSGQP
ncbi:hypothetical protein ASG90_16335 [Nocardioides sp. Soil797]|nr:hypothetical protein ASG90_16335 [Nocardioides sp. Soil797]